MPMLPCIHATRSNWHSLDHSIEKADVLNPMGLLPRLNDEGAAPRSGFQQMPSLVPRFGGSSRARLGRSWQNAVDFAERRRNDARH